jgi:serine/threonine protein kinase
LLLHRVFIFIFLSLFCCNIHVLLRKNIQIKYSNEVLLRKLGGFDSDIVMGALPSPSTHSLARDLHAVARVNNAWFQLQKKEEEVIGVSAVIAAASPGASLGTAPAGVKQQQQQRRNPTLFLRDYKHAMFLPLCGRNLECIMRLEHPALDPPYALGLVKELALAVRHLHDRNVAHGQLVAANVVRMEGCFGGSTVGRLLLVDFGAATLSCQGVGSDQQQQQQTEEEGRGVASTAGESNSGDGVLCAAAMDASTGSNGSVSAKSASGASRGGGGGVSCAADIWSFGLLLFELFAGRPFVSNYRYCVAATGEGEGEGETTEERVEERGYHQENKQKESRCWSRDPAAFATQIAAYISNPELVSLLCTILHPNPEYRPAYMSDILNSAFFKNGANNTISVPDDKKQEGALDDAHETVLHLQLNRECITSSVTSPAGKDRHHADAGTLEDMSRHNALHGSMEHHILEDVLFTDILNDISPVPTPLPPPTTPGSATPGFHFGQVQVGDGVGGGVGGGDEKVDVQGALPLLAGFAVGISAAIEATTAVPPTAVVTTEAGAVCAPIDHGTAAAAAAAATDPAASNNSAGLSQQHASSPPPPPPPPPSAWTAPVAGSCAEIVQLCSTRVPFVDARGSEYKCETEREAFYVHNNMSVSTQLSTDGAEQQQQLVSAESGAGAEQVKGRHKRMAAEVLSASGATLRDYDNTVLVSVPKGAIADSSTALHLSMMVLPPTSIVAAAASQFVIAPVVQIELSREDAGLLKPISVKLNHCLKHPTVSNMHVALYDEVTHVWREDVDTTQFVVLPRHIQLHVFRPCVVVVTFCDPMALTVLPKVALRSVHELRTTEADVPGSGLGLSLGLGDSSAAGGGASISGGDVRGRSISSDNSRPSVSRSNSGALNLRKTSTSASAGSNGAAVASVLVCQAPHCNTTFGTLVGRKRTCLYCLGSFCKAHCSQKMNNRLCCDQCYADSWTVYIQASCKYCVQLEEVTLKFNPCFVMKSAERILISCIRQNHIKIIVQIDLTESRIVLQSLYNEEIVLSFRRPAVLLLRNFYIEEHETCEWRFVRGVAK